MLAPAAHAQQRQAAPDDDSALEAPACVQARVGIHDSLHNICTRVLHQTCGRTHLSTENHKRILLLQTDCRTPCNSNFEDDHPLTSHACSGSQTGSIDKRAEFHNSQFRIAQCAAQNQRSICQWGRTPPHAYDFALHGPRWFPYFIPFFLPSTHLDKS
jgi:hypothetical protein